MLRSPIDHFAPRWAMILLAFVLTSLIGGAVAAQASEDHDGQAQTTPSTRTITITMTDDLRFTPDIIHVRRGETIRFVLENPTPVPHDFTLGSEATQDRHAHQMEEGMGHDEDGDAISLEPFSTTEYIRSFDELDVVIIGCHVLGHYEAGMRATLMTVPEWFEITI